MKTSLLVATLGTLLCSHYALAAPDISGVQIGVPLATQKNLIMKANPAYQLEDVKLRNGAVAGVTGVARKNGQAVDQMVVLTISQGWSGTWLGARRWKMASEFPRRRSTHR